MLKMPLEELLKRSHSSNDAGEKMIARADSGWWKSTLTYVISGCFNGLYCVLWGCTYAVCERLDKIIKLLEEKP